MSKRNSQEASGDGNQVTCRLGCPPVRDAQKSQPGTGLVPRWRIPCNPESRTSAQQGQRYSKQRELSLGTGRSKRDTRRDMRITGRRSVARVLRWKRCVGFGMWRWTRTSGRSSIVTPRAPREKPAATIVSAVCAGVARLTHSGSVRAAFVLV